MAEYSPSDQELCWRIQQGDQVALKLLYERYNTPVYSLCYRVLSNAALAEEAAQDTFLKVWRQVEKWDSGKGRFISWLLTVARYTAIDRLRQEQRQSIRDAVPLDELDVPDEHPDYGFVDGQLLRQLLRQLPPEQLQVIELAFFHGLTHQVLAERLSLPLGTVKTRVRLGLQKLRVLWLEATEYESD